MATSGLPPPFQNFHDFVPLLAAAIGNVAASIVRVPPEVIKQRVQAGIYRDIFQATRAMWATEGLPGFYCGYSMQVAREIPYSALQFMTFEYLKKRSSPDQNPRRDKRFAKRLVHDLCIGALAGAVACTLTTPLDVAKTRVMTQNPSNPLVYMGLQATLQKIWLEEGIVGFGRGMVPRVLYKVPASAVFLVCYEAMKRLLVTTRKVRRTTHLGSRTGHQHLAWDVAVQTLLCDVRRKADSGVLDTCKDLTSVITQDQPSILSLALKQKTLRSVGTTGHICQN